MTPEPDPQVVMQEVITRDGLHYFVDPTDARAQRLVDTSGEFNAVSVRIFQSLLARRPWDLVIDVGANYGEMIAAIPAGFKGDVVAFEPNEHLLPFLRRTAERTGLKVDIRAQAVGRRDGSAQFVIDPTWSGQSSLRGVETASPEQLVDIDVVTLDSQFRERLPTTALIKIDVEGAEIDVLKGGTEFLFGLDDSALQIEILHMPHEQIAALATQWRMYFLSRESLSPVRLPGGDTRLAELYVSSGRFYQNDVILLPVFGDRPLWA